MDKKTTRHDGANTPALPSRRAFFGTAAAVASVAAVPALAAINPTPPAGHSDFASAVAAWMPLEAESSRLSGVLEAAYARRKPYCDRHHDACLYFQKVRSDARGRAMASPEHRERIKALSASHKEELAALKASGASDDVLSDAAVNMISQVWD